MTLEPPCTPLRNPLLDALRTHRLVTLMAARMAHGPEIAQLASAAGFDAICVDLERSSLSLDDAKRICIACLGTAVTPLVRVPQIDSAHVSRALDGGALGIIAPHIRNAADAQRLVGLCRFPPEGKRPHGPMLPHFGYRSVPRRDAAALLNRMTAVIATVEDRASLDHAEEIAAADGVDMLFVGCQDLCGDLGIAVETQDETLGRILGDLIRMCRLKGKAIGIGGLADCPELLADCIRQGAGLVGLGTDLAMFAEGARARIASALRDADAGRRLSA